MAIAEKLRSELDFAHTSDAKLLPRGESSVTGPVVRLFKPFDEQFVDSKVCILHWFCYIVYCCGMFV